MRSIKRTRNEVKRGLLSPTKAARRAKVEQRDTEKDSRVRKDIDRHSCTIATEPFLKICLRMVAAGGSAATK